MSYSICCTDLSSSGLNLFLSIYSFWCFFKWNCFLNLLSDGLLLVYRKATDFNTLIVYPEALMNLIIIYNSFFWSLKFFICNIISSADTFSSSFPIWMSFIFIFLAWLLCIGIQYDVKWKGQVWVSLSCTWPWKKSFHLYTTEDDISCRLTTCDLYYIQVQFIFK